MTQSRRSSTEVRCALLEAAAKVFAERGYAAATTLAIATGANTTEKSIFRHFNNKEQLFEAAVLEPVAALMESFVEKWRQRERGTQQPEDEAREFYRDLYNTLKANRGLIIAVAAETRPPTGARPPWGAALERLEGVLAWEGDHRPFEGFDPIVMTRLMFSLVFTLAIWTSPGSVDTVSELS